MLIEENRRTARLFDEGVSTPASPNGAEKESGTRRDCRGGGFEEEEEPLGRSKVSWTRAERGDVVAEEPKNATLVEEEQPVVITDDVEKKPGSLEAQRAALSTIAELQREAFFAADARAEELLDANSTVLNATRAVIETSEILAGLDDDQCTVMAR